MADHWRGLVSVAETSECLAEVRSVDTNCPEVEGLNSGRRTGELLATPRC